MVDTHMSESEEAPTSTLAKFAPAPKKVVKPAPKKKAAVVKDETPVASGSKPAPKKKAPAKPKIKLSANQEAFYKELLEHGAWGVPKQIADAIGMTDSDELGETLNALLAVQLIEMSKATKGGVTQVRAISKDEVKKKSGLEEEATLVLSTITSHGNMGIWVRNIPLQTGLTQAVVERVLKKLVKDKFVKQVSSIRGKTQRIYMLYELEPSVELTGGPWYSDNELDIDFVNKLMGICETNVREASYPKQRRSAANAPPKMPQYYPVHHDAYLPHARQLLEALRPVLKADTNLTPEHIETLMDALVADGLIERIEIFRAEEDIWALDVGEEATNEAAAERKRKRAGKDDGGVASKRARPEPDSDHVDEDSAEEPVEGSESEGESALPPPLDFDTGAGPVKPDKLEISTAASHGTKPGPPGRKPYYVYRAVHREKPSRSVKSANNPDKAAIPLNYLGHTLGLVGDSPCGMCPVRNQCDNRGQPVPSATSSLSQPIQPPRKLVKDEDLLRIKAPQTMDDHADGVWRGGGTRGYQRLGPVNPVECLYFDQWFAAGEGDDGVIDW